MDTSKIITKVKQCVFALKAAGVHTKTTGGNETVTQCLGAVIGDLELLSARSEVKTGDVSSPEGAGAVAGKVADIPAGGIDIDSPGGDTGLEQLAGGVEGAQNVPPWVKDEKPVEMPKISKKSGKKGKSRNYIDAV